MARRRSAPQRRTHCVRATLNGWLLTSAVVRTRLRRESSLGAVCGDSIGERRGAVIRTSAVSATSRMSWSRRVAGARSRALGVATATGSSPVETFVAFVRAPMQKFHLPHSLAKPTPTPNHAMQLTASKLAIYASGVCHRASSLRARPLWARRS